MDETYDRILLGIPRERQAYAQRLFKCLAEPIRPLRAEELAEVLAIQFGEGELPIYNANWRPQNPEEAVLSTCSSLITIIDVGSSRVIQFSHFSVKEYLTSKRLAKAGEHLSLYHILPRSAHSTLAQASLSVLLALDEVDKVIMKNFPFAIYAARYWVDHAQFADVCSSIQPAMEQLFDPAKPHFSTWVWIYDIDHTFRGIMYEARPTSPEAVPLYYATLCGFFDLINHLLIIYPEDVNVRGGHHGTPLHAAVVKGNVQVMMVLLEHGADVAALNKDGWTPLYVASHRGHLHMVLLLLDHNADINSRNPDGWTPLFNASFEGELEIVRELLRYGAAVDIVNNDGRTPLMSASYQGRLNLVRLLLQSGAALDSQNDDGWTALMCASQYGHPDVVRLLLQSEAAVDLHNNDGSTPLLSASWHGQLVVVRLLLENGASANSQNHDGFTALMYASEQGHLDMARLLLQNDASVDPQNNGGWTPLMCASRHGHPDVVRLLLQSGAAVDLHDNDGWTPLLSASWHGQPVVVRLLLENGASANSQNHDGLTALMCASAQGHLDIVRLLLQSGAAVDPNPNDAGFPSNGVFPIPSRSYCASLIITTYRFKFRGPRLMLFSLSGIRSWPSHRRRTPYRIRCRR